MAFDSGPVLYHDDNISPDNLLRPRIVTPLPLKHQCKIGGELRLLCLLTGYPSIEINWYLNGELLEATEDNRIRFDNQKRLLVIKDLRYSDSGSITFEAKNKYGEELSSCLLEVVGKKEIKFGNHSPKPIRRLMHVLNRMKSF